MNFIDDRELAERFAKGAVPNRERLTYLLINSLFFAVMTTDAMYSLLGADKILNFWTWTSDVVAIAVLVAGTVLSYRVNERGDGEEFIERYVSLGFPILIRTFLLGLGLIVVVLALDGVFPGFYDYEQSNAVSFVLLIAMLAYFYHRLYRAIEIASGAAPGPISD